MKTKTNERRRETMSALRFFALAVLILIISVTAVIVGTKATATQNMRENGELVTITSFSETEPHRETISIWDYNNDYTNEHYTNIEYYEYSGTYVVEVETYNGKNLGKFEVKPEYYGEDKIFEGAEIEMYKLQPIKRDIEKIVKETPNKEILQEIQSVEKEERTQNLVPIKSK